MTRHPATCAAVLIGVVLAATASGCAPTSSPAPTATVPVPVPVPDISTDPATAAPTATAKPFAPTAVRSGRAGIPAGGLPLALTLTSADPDVVAAAGLTAYYRADTALDLGPADTHRRALPWITGQLAAGIRGDRPVTGPGAAWTTLATHHGYTTVTITRAYDDGAPPDTASTAFRQFVMTITPHGRDQWTRPSATRTDFLRLRRTTGGWRIVDIADNP